MMVREDFERVNGKRSGKEQLRLFNTIVAGEGAWFH